MGGVGKLLLYIKFGGRGVIINWGGWKSLTKKFEFTQNLHEFERIRAILANFQKVSTSFLKFLRLGGHKWVVKKRNFGN